MSPAVALAVAVFAGKGERDLASDDWLDAVLDRLLREFERAEQIVGVGDGNRRRFVFHGVADDLAELKSTFQQRISRMHAQMDKRPRRHLRTRRRNRGFALQGIAWKSVIRHGFSRCLGL